MKKIVILTQYFLPEMGAPQSRLYETAIGLRKLGWDVKIVTAMPNYPTGKVFEGYRNEFFRKDNIDGIDVYRYSLYASNSRSAFPRIISMLSFSVTSVFSLLRILKFRPAFVFTESPPLTLGLSGLLLAKISGAKHLLNISDLWPLSAYSLGAISKGFLYRRLEGLERILYRNSYACIGQSGQIITHVKNNGSRIAHLYRNGVDYERFENIRNTLRVEKNGRLRIVYAGLLGVAQGILELCRNVDFAKLGAELHIYGDGADRDAVEEYIRNNPGKGIFYYGYVKRSDVPATIMQYDVTLVPLVLPIYGAVPSKIYEAMAAGLPVLFTGGGEGAEIINQYHLGWTCEPSDYNNIVRLIGSIASMSNQELECIKQNCINTAKNIFNRQIQLRELNAFLTDHAIRK